MLICYCYLICFAIQVSSSDTLKQGPDNLNSSSHLVSANKNFTLGFYTPQDTNNTYLAIWFKDPSYMKIVWIGNRQKPIPSNASPILTIGSRGEMNITYDGGKSMQIYDGGGGGDGSGQQSVTATLLDSGNFVVNSNESLAPLWQSFDHPTDTLLPGMKIGKNLILSSWLRDDDPAPGSFTLEWDPSEAEFLVRRRGQLYWRSGELKYYHDEEGKSRVELDNFSFVRDAFNFYFNFTNDEEGNLIFSVIPLPAPFPTQNVISGWKLDDDGNIIDIDRTGAIAMPSLCYSNYYTQGPGAIRGCAAREQPECRNEHQKFTLKSGDFRPDKGVLEQIHDSNSSLSLSDCMEACWNDCECAAYTTGTTGCLYWKGKDLEFVQSVAGTSVQKYFLEDASTGLVRLMVLLL